MSALAEELSPHSLLLLASCPETQRVPFSTTRNGEKQANPRFKRCCRPMFCDIFSRASGVALWTANVTVSLVQTEISPQLAMKIWQKHSHRRLTNQCPLRELLAAIVHGLGVRTSWRSSCLKQQWWFLKRLA